MKINENDETRLEELKGTYRQIVRYLDLSMEKGKLTALQRWVIQETSRKVAENLAVRHKR